MYFFSCDDPTPFMTLALYAKSRSFIQRQVPQIRPQLPYIPLAKLLLAVRRADRWRQNNILSRFPVNRRRDPPLITQLQAFNHPQYLRRVTSCAGWVHHRQTNLLGGVDDEDRTDRERNATLFGEGVEIGLRDHVILVRDAAVRVGDDREGDGGGGELVDVVDPLVVRTEVVCRLLSGFPYSQQTPGDPTFTRVRRGEFSIKRQRTSPTILTPLLSNSPFIFAKAPSSVVQTGVKSAGCEKRIAQLPSMNLWKSMSPCVVLHWKFGAEEPRRRRGCSGSDADAKVRLGMGWKDGVQRVVARRPVLRARGAARDRKRQFILNGYRRIGKLWLMCTRTVFCD